MYFRWFHFICYSLNLSTFFRKCSCTSLVLNFLFTFFSTVMVSPTGWGFYVSRETCWQCKALGPHLTTKNNLGKFFQYLGQAFNTQESKRSWYWFNNFLCLAMLVFSPQLHRLWFGEAERWVTVSKEPFKLTHNNEWLTIVMVNFLVRWNG